MAWGTDKTLLNLVRFAHNWNDGMLEYWNDGLALFEQILAPLRSAIGKLEDGNFFTTVLIIPYKSDKITLFRSSIPIFHHSIIPVWKKKKRQLETLYYQAFLEFPIHIEFVPFGQDGIPSTAGKATKYRMIYNSLAFVYKKGIETFNLLIFLFSYLPNF